MRDRSSGLTALKCVAGYVLDAYAGLRDTFLRVSDIVQSRQSRQPFLVTDGGFSATEFDGNSVLESVLKIEPFSALTVYLVAAFGDQGPGPHIFMDVGIKTKSGPRISLGYEDGRIVFRFIDEQETVCEVSASSAPPKQFLFIVARCQPVRRSLWRRKALVLSVSVDTVGASRRFPGIELPSALEAKQTFGTDIFGRQGTVFQMTESGVWPKSFTADEERRLYDNVINQSALPPGWIPSKGKVGYVTKLYNQAAMPKGDEC